MFARLAPVALLLAGCPSTALLGSARTLEPGQTEVGGSLGPSLGLTSDTRTFGLDPHVAGHLGLANRVELDADVGLGSVTAGPKLAVLKSPGRLWDVDLSLAPQLGLLYYPGPAELGGLYGTSQLALLAGLNLGGGTQLVVGPRVLGGLRPAAPRDTAFGLGGITADLYLRVTPHLSLVPEAGAYRYLAVPPHLSGETLWLRASLGLLYAT